MIVWSVPQTNPILQGANRLCTCQVKYPDEALLTGIDWKRRQDNIFLVLNCFSHILSPVFATNILFVCLVYFVFIDEWRSPFLRVKVNTSTRVLTECYLNKQLLERERWQRITRTAAIVVNVPTTCDTRPETTCSFAWTVACICRQSHYANRLFQRGYFLYLFIISTDKVSFI